MRKEIRVLLYLPYPDSSAILNESREMRPSEYMPTDIPSPQPEQYPTVRKGTMGTTKLYATIC